MINIRTLNNIMPVASNNEYISDIVNKIYNLTSPNEHAILLFAR